MKVLLTGGSGFIGTNLARMLIASKSEVVALGRRDCPVDRVLNVSTNRLDPEAVRDVVAARRFDVIFHLAAAGVNPGDRNRNELIRLNTLMPAELVACAADTATAVVLMGSSAEYAAQSGGLLGEDMPLETTKLYGSSKAAGSLLGLATAAELRVRAAVLRAFNVFGQGESAHRLLPSLAGKLARGEATDLSLGTQVRDFLYVDDACSGLIAAATALLDGRMVNGVYNLSTGRGASVADFARTVARRMGADESLLRFGALPFRPDDLPVVVGDPSRLGQATGWQATHSLDEGIGAALLSLASN